MNTEVHKILIVDDRPENLLVLAKTLEPLQMQVVKAFSGNEALALTLEHDFALAIIDIQMPEMNGYELVNLLRGNRKTNSLPVIFVSAIYADNYHHMKGYESGAVDFLSKPFEPAILLSKVRIFLELYSQKIQLQNTINQLKTQTQKLNEVNLALVKQTTQIQTAHRIGEQITSILDLSELLNSIIGLVQNTFDYEYVRIWLVDRHNKNNLMLRAGSSRHDQIGIHLKMSLPMNMLDNNLISACHSKKIVLQTNLQTSQYHHFGQPIRTELIIPLVLGSDLLGVLDIASKKENDLNKDDQILFELLAHTMTITIHNAQLYTQVVNFNEELESKVQERTRELQEAYEILSELDRNKSDFIQVVSHELRTPLTLIQGYSQLLGMVPQIPAEYQQYVSGIVTGSVRMHQIINSMLDMAKIDNQTLHLSVNFISLPFIWKQLQDTFASVLEERQLHLHLEFEDDFPNLEGDEDLLRKVFNHLMTNAVKYTPDGGKITVFGRQVDKSHVEITIQDTGIGIAPEFQQLIFDKFYRVGKAALHSSSNSKFKGGGPGLGLAIARGIVHAHGGHIWVESEGYSEEKYPGSCFHVILPLELPKILEPISEEELLFN